MKGIFFKGNVREVCAALKAEAERCKGSTVERYIRKRQLEEVERKQFGAEKVDE